MEDNYHLVMENQALRRDLAHLRSLVDKIEMVEKRGLGTRKVGSSWEVYDNNGVLATDSSLLGVIYKI